jgi:hypothetical protein
MIIFLIGVDIITDVEIFRLNPAIERLIDEKFEGEI